MKQFYILCCGVCDVMQDEIIIIYDEAINITDKVCNWLIKRGYGKCPIIKKN